MVKMVLDKCRPGKVRFDNLSNYQQWDVSKFVLGVFVCGLSSKMVKMS